MRLLEVTLLVCRTKLDHLNPPSDVILTSLVKKMLSKWFERWSCGQPSLKIYLEDS